LGWKAYDRFTLRVSWPASHPVQVALSLHSPALPSASSSERTARVHFARIRLVQEGVRVPNHHAGIELGPENRYGEGGSEAVPLVVLLEPLLLGVLPTSVAPTAVTVLCVLVFLAYGVLPRIWARLGRVVESARGELAALEETKEKLS